jgi:WD40 repeat protein
MLRTPVPLLALLLSFAVAYRPAAAGEPEQPADLQPLVPVSRLHLFNIRNYGPGNLFALSPDGATLVSANGNNLTVYDLTKNQSQIQPRNVMVEGVFLRDGTLVFSGDSKFVVALSAQHMEDQSLHFIDIGTGKEVHQIDNDESFNSLALSADGKMLAVGGVKRQSRLRRLQLYV